MRQSSFFPKQPLFYGGELSKGKRKTARPLAIKRPLHLILKAKRNLYIDKVFIESEVRCQAKKFGLRVYDLAIAFDHIHILTKIPGRREYKAFIRVLTAILVRELGWGLWLLLPFTRIVSWGRDFLGVRKYIEKNRKEASGALPYEVRKDWYKRYKNSG